MKQDIIQELSVALSLVFTVEQQLKLLEAIYWYEPGSFMSDFQKKFTYTLGPSLIPLVKAYEPAFSMYPDGIGVKERFAWEGVILKHTHDIPIRFEQSYVYTFENMVELESEHIYPREYTMPSSNELIEALTTLLIQRLNSVSVLYFFIAHKSSLIHLFKPVYTAIGSRPIHEGILKTIAEEPDNHNRFNSRHLTWEGINRNLNQTHIDITRSYDLTITAQGHTWKIREADTGTRKAEIYDAALRSIQQMQCLPPCVLDALYLGAHQSGFLNEAVIALGVYMMKSSNDCMTLPQSGVERRLKFLVANQTLQITDCCQWHDIVVPLLTGEGDALEREQVHMKKGLTLIYRYTLSAGKNNQISHQIKELSLKNEPLAKALVPK